MEHQSVLFGEQAKFLDLFERINKIKKLLRF
jgi:hypothetical protein